MTLQSFVHKWIGKPADFDNVYGFQCVDIVQFYNRDVNGCPFLAGATALDIWNNSPAMYEKILNTPTNMPQPGDIVFFKYNHVAIVLLADVLSMTTFDQNYPIGSYCHVEQHDYGAVSNPMVLGWWRRK